jgi:hypothetical protein
MRVEQRVFLAVVEGDTSMRSEKEGTDCTYANESRGEKQERRDRIARPMRSCPGVVFDGR